MSYSRKEIMPYFLWGFLALGELGVSVADFFVIIVFSYFLSVAIEICSERLDKAYKDFYK